MRAYVHITQRILCRANGFRRAYAVPHPARGKRKKRQGEKECALETPWILETRIGLVRLMNIDEPFPTYQPDRTSIVCCHSTAIFLFSSSSYYFSLTDFLSACRVVSQIFTSVLLASYLPRRSRCKYAATRCRCRQLRSIENAVTSAL